MPAAYVSLIKVPVKHAEPSNRLESSRNRLYKASAFGQLGILKAFLRGYSCVVLHPMSNLMCRGDLIQLHCTQDGLALRRVT